MLEHSCSSIVDWTEEDIEQNCQKRKKYSMNTDLTTLHVLRLQICDLNSCNGAKLNSSQMIFITITRILG